MVLILSTGLEHPRPALWTRDATSAAEVDGGAQVKWGGVRGGKPRVLVLVENLSVPFDRRVWHESLALTEAGFEVHVACPRGVKRDTERTAIVDGVYIHRFRFREAQGDGPAGYVIEYVAATFHLLAIAFRLGWRNPFAVVQICNPPDLLFVAALPLKLRGTKVVFDHHDLVPELLLSRFGGERRAMYWISRLLERITFLVADAVVSTNESYRQVALSRGGKSPNSVEVVRNGPDLGRFVPVKPVRELKGGREHLLCYLGVMGYQDGVDYALRAVGYLRHGAGREDFKAVFIGEGDAFDSSVRLAGELQLDDCVEFTGRISDEGVRQYLSTADVCLAPDPPGPLNDVSTMTKIMEYMAMGKPIVSFDLAETRVSAADAALYAPDGDERQFGELIIRLLDDPELRTSMGSFGRERVEKGLSWDSSARSLTEFYRRVLALPEDAGSG